MSDTESIPARRRPGRWLAAGTAVVLAAAAGALLLTRHRADAEPAPPETSPVATAEIERRDLSTVRALPGTIGFGAAQPLAGRLEATVTWLPKAGATIKRGKQVYRADDRPVPLFYGSMPLYRTIGGKDLTGRDVRIVGSNLRALGYATGPLSEKLTDTLVKAIKAWQRDRELPETGEIGVGDVVVQAGPIRVDSLTAQPGATANGPLMTVTPTLKVITVTTTPVEAGAIRRGAKVTVALPDERTAAGRVLSVGRTVTTADGTGDPQLAVTVLVDDPKKIAKVDSADVEVEFAGRTSQDVLAVPVQALVALSEGGYAVQTPAGLVAVTTGMFAQGWVEITGDGLDEGISVVVTS